ncbi:MAG TPA: hypothetical protein VHU84_16030, partial [Lacipirellulaceae bacterium]|nr:hypothetical protein [Lacipirellulaceae bacterium]
MRAAAWNQNRNWSAFDMFRRLTFALVAIVFAASFRPAAAQRPYRVPDIHNEVTRGYTDKELVQEKKLLNDKSKSITWESLPLIQFPRDWSMQGSPVFWEALLGDKYRESQRKFAAADKRFVDAKLKDKSFSGTVRITRKEPGGKEFTIYSNEPSRPKWTDKFAPHEFAVSWPAYFCQWQAESDRSFHVGEDVDIAGKIEDL